MSLLLLLRNHQSSGQPPEPEPETVPLITVGAPVLRRRRRSTGRISGTSDLTATGHISFDSLADEDELLTII